MSTTRRAQEGAPLRQERWMSSAAFERGLLANLVARRCEVIERPEDRELVWWLQHVSHEPGGLPSLVETILKQWPERNATRSMQRFGCATGRVYNAAEVRAIRAEMPHEEWSGPHFPLRSDEFVLPEHQWVSAYALMGSAETFEDEKAEAKREFRKAPDSYRVERFMRECQQAANGLVDWITQLCLDPDRKPEGGPWYFPTLIQTLREAMQTWIDARACGHVTEIGHLVHDTLDFCLETGRMVLIEGNARLGKTHAVQRWCDQHPGRARYVQCPAANDDLSFLRAIARGIGVTQATSMKVAQLRERIELALVGSGVALVFDEAHYLFGQSFYQPRIPQRINWIMTALVNQGVPIALVSTPQLMRSQKRVEQKTGWTGEQFTGRIGHYQALPDKLARHDLEGVAAVKLPEGDAATHRLLAAYAASSARYLAAIDAVVARARFLARREGRDSVKRADIKRAIEEGVIPSDSALAAAMAKAEPRRRGCPSRQMEAPLQVIGKGIATPVQAAGNEPEEEADFTRRASAGSVKLTPAHAP